MLLQTVRRCPNVCINIGSKYKKIREKKGISAYKLSKIADVGVSTIAEIENGKRQNLTTSTIEKIANALKVSVDELLTADNNKEHIVTDIYQTINVILTRDELTLDGIPLSNIEKEQFTIGVNALLDIIRTQRKCKSKNEKSNSLL